MSKLSPYFDGAAKTARVARHGDDVNMVGHQAISPDFHARLVRLFGQKIAINILIALLEEDRFAAIAALGDVMRAIRNDDAGRRVMACED